jgi:hypothetical protein
VPIVWTPKRILILVGGLLLFGSGFVVYSLFLGGFDGLPALPEEYARGDEDVEPIQPTPSETFKKMQQAFGPDSEEMQRSFQLDLGSREILLAFDQFDIEDDGKVKLSKFSAALFPKNRQPETYPEINTVTSAIALLTLNEPVANFHELTNRRIIGVELRDDARVSGVTGVRFINNRRSPEKHDDIELRVTQGPVYYEESSQRIWTDGFVKLLDQQSQPNPTEIEAKGMELHLTKDGVPSKVIAKATPKAAPKKGDKNKEPVTGIDLLVLKSHVDMHLWVDAKSGFLASPQEFGVGQGKPKPPNPNEKSHVIIKTNGPFRYEPALEVARFDAPPPEPGGAAIEQVLVSREHKVEGAPKIDQLYCDALELRFRKVAGGGGDPRNNKEIDTALATARAGREIVLSMDSENLEAYGAKLFYRSATETSGPQTILEGQPMHAIREGHKIMARELHLIGADKKGNGQQAYAKGPGRIDLLDKKADNGAKATYSTHAVWNDSLISTKDRDGDRVFDLLTLTGNAAFVDEEHQQALHAQRLMVWLEQLNGPNQNKAQAGNAARQKPHKLEGYEQVRVFSPEMIIERCNKLVVCFKEIPAVDDRLPDVAPAPPMGVPKGVPGVPMAEGIGPLSVQAPTAVPLPPLPGKDAGERKEREPKDRAMAKEGDAEKKAGGPLSILPGAPADKGKTRKPIHLSANDVVAYVTTQGTKKQLQELVTDGDVHVTQEGETPKDKGVDITGAMLNLLYHPLGNTLYVMGDTRRPGQLQLGDLILIGPKVTINQKENIAEVEGVGAMTMPSKTTFEGAKTKPGTTVTVHWNKNMIFNGKFAEFHGGIQAFQDKASLKCETLQVTLDRVVSFKEGQKKDQSANVEKMVADRKVYVLEDIKTPEGKRLSYKRLQATALAMDNQDGPINASGWGRVDYIAQGSGDGALKAPINAKPDPAKKPGKDKPLTWTRVDFEGRMWALNTPLARTAKFLDNVEVYNQPGDDPDVPVKPNQPAKGGFYMRCDVLEVNTRELPDKTTTQSMVATRNVFFRTPEHYGQADTVKYDESQDTIIFEGAPATLFKLGPPGSQPERIQGNRILYNRKTGEMSLAGGQVIESR